MISASSTHLVLIPSYNTGRLVFQTVREARQFWQPVWVVIDGSTDDTQAGLQDMARDDPGLRILTLPRNRGKGAAILHGLLEARKSGFTHVLTMDADGQHPADQIPNFMAASITAPKAMVLCQPIFDASAPTLRVRGRRISNWMANLETLWAGIGDSLSGFRVYPIDGLIAVMQDTRWMRRFDFDPEAAVRLCWQGAEVINLPAPVRYLRADQGGVSHFQYGRDNLLLSWMHGRLMVGMLRRLPSLVRARQGRKARALPWTRSRQRP
jgi:glycosyltransferase involved in cell wall biosynthesis